MVQCDRNLFPFGVSSWSTLLYHVCLFHYHGNVITSTLSVVRVHLCNDCKRSTPHSIVRWRLVQFPGCFSVNWELFLSACVLRRFAVDCPRVFLRRFFPGLLSCVPPAILPWITLVCSPAMCVKCWILSGVSHKLFLWMVLFNRGCVWWRLVELSLNIMYSYCLTADGDFRN